MLHRLCGPPSISLSFSLATVLPRRGAYSVSLATAGVNTRNGEHPTFTAWTTRVSNPVCSPRFRASTSVTVDQDGCLRHLVFLLRSTHFTATPRIPPSLSHTLAISVSVASSSVEPKNLTTDLQYAVYAPLYAQLFRITLVPLRITAAAGTRVSRYFL